MIRVKTAVQTRDRVWIGLAIILTLVKIWLTRAQPIYAIGNAPLDDRLFLELAQHLINGEWLGQYTESTLAKGPAYSIFIAAVFFLGIPLGLAQQLLYAGACAVFARAIRPAVSLGAQTAIYLTLLWNPMSYEAATLGRVMRQHLATPLGMIVIGALVALYLRRELPLRRQMPWASLFGCSLGTFWLTREESIWIIPSVLVLAGGHLFGAWRNSNRSARVILVLSALATLMAITPHILVSWQNFRHYGWFGTVELKSGAFKAAYGALQRVQVGPELPQVPVSRKTRNAIYPVSSAFKTLEPWLERDAWSTPSNASKEREILGGWFMWALRESVALSGQAPTAQAALQFYQQLAHEVNTACDAGRLPCRPRRDSLLPPLQEGQTVEIGRTFFRFLDFVVFFKAFDAYPQLSIGDREELKLFYDLTGDELASSRKDPTIERPNQEAMRALKYYALQYVGARLIEILSVVCIVAHVIAVVRLVQQIRARAFAYPFVLAVSTWVGMAAFLVINSTVQVVSFSVIAVSTFSPIYPFVLLFYVAVTWDATAAWTHRPASDPTTSSAWSDR